MARVLQINLYDAGLSSAVQEIIRQCDLAAPRQNRCVSATDAHGLVTAYRKPAFKAVLNSFYWNLPDGMPSVWIGKLNGAKQMTRCYGPDLFRDVFENSASTSIKHFLCGGKEGVADELKAAVGKKFGNLQVAGTYCPPFREMEDHEFRALAETINQSGANIVWIGISSPKQEYFAQRLAQFTNVNFIVTVGAAFDFHTDRVRQAPGWMQKASLEWLFRLTMEPKRLYKRYLKVIPLFILFNIKEAFSPKTSYS
ncbi:WecB/TagA/CpsF family glycosyltransferase [Spirosoma sp. HMF4905]|uniref:WecB/TagA/CpsF family glycosyltransferase n=1 Tax=Spirosoma arboris TaxID=2682092 RepID=A0A7K1S9F1_9BACT|nr:WecB/TagA/CpsF family glycosyltransferase [Spirosoma arboris]MVM30439.1 WecB/TagA/CpsF family glycosyltransferase [Spirosoma arboris]